MSITKPHSSATLACVDLAAVAAFTAAGLSLINVAISTRQARRGDQEQWRREQELPIVARCLTLSRDAGKAWWDTSVEMEPDIPGAPGETATAREHLRTGNKALNDLRYEASQLDLLASRPVRQAVADLVRAHENEFIMVLPNQPREDSERRIRSSGRFQELETVLLDRTRADFGFSDGLAVPAPRSVIGKIRSRRQRG